MSRIPSHGREPGYPDADNDASVGQQEAALIWELRRLQRFVDEEHDQQRFTRSTCNTRTGLRTVRPASGVCPQSNPTAKSRGSSTGWGSTGASRRSGRGHTVSH